MNCCPTRYSHLEFFKLFFLVCNLYNSENFVKRNFRNCLHFCTSYFLKFSHICIFLTQNKNFVRPFVRMFVHPFVCPIVRPFQGCFKEVLRVFQRSFKSVFRKFQGNFKAVK